MSSIFLHPLQEHDLGCEEYKEETSPKENRFSSQPVADLKSLKTQFTQQPMLLSVVNTSITALVQGIKYWRMEKPCTQRTMILCAVTRCHHSSRDSYQTNLENYIENVSIIHVQLQVRRKTSKNNTVTKITSCQTT